ncbi:outer membrane beta-barrel protein [Saccharicrinis fermentans]|uniref:Outer membrane protein beta-barrel domain-containing protein n=1 Tax=Saccharicrinis fermentans DSM 9555 = JCM 21142 TaxID=869213 RepID=W7YTZ5_9BACT|nr:outer membrane beta-barrel protein [Saccharicrinis fermentans]GAF05919.1 hypothetical protein JCM21142_124680 [Saccharicrinis fermentans DSM 9555 = JCM 21142]
MSHKVSYWVNLLLITALMSVSFNLFSQNLVEVKGHVLDSTTLAPIEFVNIVAIRQIDSTYVLGTTSDNSGNFSMIVPNNVCLIKLSAIGYKEKTVNLIKCKDPKLDNIKLERNLIALETVDITAQAYNTELNNGILIFKPNKNAISINDTGLDILRLSPTVYLSSSNKIVIHGNSEQASVMIDGRILPSNQVESYLSSLKANDIKSVEIQEANAVNQDANLQGGIINITTNLKTTGLTFQVSPSINYYGNNYYYQSSGTNLSLGQENWKLYGSYYYKNGQLKWDKKDNYTKTRYYYEDLIINEKSKGESFPKMHNAVFGGVFNNTKHKIGFETIADFNIPGKKEGQNEIFLSDTNGVYKDYGIRISSPINKTQLINTSLFYTYYLDSLGSKLGLEGSILSNESDYINITSSSYETNSSRDINEKNISSGNSFDKYVKIDYYKVLPSNTSIQLGIKHNSTKITSRLSVDTLNESNNWVEDSIINYTYDEKITAAYLSLKKSFKNNTIKAGIRLEQTKIDGISQWENSNDVFSSNSLDIFPYINVTSRINEKDKLSFTYSKSITRPYFVLLTNFVNRTSDFMYDVGNPELEPQIRHTINLGANRNNHYAKAFLYYTDKMFSENWETVDSLIYHTTKNNGNSLVCGLGYSYNGYLYKKWYCSFNASVYYQNIPNSYYKKNYITSSTNINNRIKINKNSSFNLYGTYRSSYIAANTLQKNLFFIDLSYSYAFFKSSLDCKILITDIFNSNNTASEVRTPYFEYDINSKHMTQAIQLKVTYKVASQKRNITKEKNISDNKMPYRL